MFRQVKEEHRTRDAETTARKDFGDLLGELFSRMVEAMPLSTLARNALSRVRDRIVNAAATLWHWFF